MLANTTQSATISLIVILLKGLTAINFFSEATNSFLVCSAEYAVGMADLLDATFLGCF